MSLFSRLTGETRPTLALAFPLIVGELSHMLTATADTVMIGQLGVTPLAAATLANTLLYLPLMFAIGLTLAVSIQVSQARGAGDPAKARSSLRHGLYLSAVMAIITVVCALAALPLMRHFRQPPEVIEAAPVYFLLVAVSFMPAMGSMVIKNHADAMNRPWAPLFILLAGVAVNVFLNWLLIYGNWGAPAWGLEGAGVATLLARFMTLIGLIFWCRADRKLRDWVPVRWLQKPDWGELRTQWALGWPTSLQLLAEISSFVAGTLIIGSLGAKALAAHQVAITCAATVFMVPMGLSQAITVRIGEAYGAGQFLRLRPLLVCGWAIGGIFTLFSASAFLIFRAEIAAWFIPMPEAQVVATALLAVAAAFQFSDALQIISVGALRGLGEVSFPAWMAFLSCWLISLPAGWIMAFPLDMGVVGIWWGFTSGLVFLALTFGYYAWKKTSPDLKRPPYLTASL